MEMPPPAMASPLSDWFLLDRFVFWTGQFAFPKDDDGASASTTSATNSMGLDIRICLELLPPPRVSRLHLQLGDDGSYHGFQVLAAHRHSLLLQMTYPIPVPDHYDAPFTDYFLYTTIDGAPTLHRLTPLNGTIAEVQARIIANTDAITDQTLRRHEGLDIGLLCDREEDHRWAVAELEITGSRAPPQLRILSINSGSIQFQWELKHPPIIPLQRTAEFCEEKFLWHFDADIVVPFQDTYLCWVDYCFGVLFCDVFHHSPKLHYLQLPAQLPILSREIYGRTCAEAYQAVGVTDAGVMKFVKVACTDTRRFSERVGRPAAPGFTITSWTLNSNTGMGMEHWEWEQDAFVTSAELWDLDGFAGLPRTALQFPVISMDEDEPGVVYFILAQDDTAYLHNKIWVVAIDMINKTLNSSSLYLNYPAHQEEQGLSADEANYFARDKLRCFQTFLPAQFDLNLDLLAPTSGGN